MRFMNVVWLILSLLILIFIYNMTNASSFFELNILAASLAFIFFFCSTIFWGLAWGKQMQIPVRISLKLNTKALAGFFSPFSIGADALRTFFAKKEGMSAADALAASFFVKFLKLFLMIIFLVIAAVLLINEPEFFQASMLFVSLCLFTLFGMFILFSFKTQRAAKFIHRLVKKEFIPEFRKSLSLQFSNFKSRTTANVLFWLFISSVFEILAVLFVFEAINSPLTLTHAFIFATVANSLALVAITPQGIGFVEGGGYVVLSFAFFGLGAELIGAFLIIWSIIRIWLPSFVGAVYTWRTSH